MCSVLGLTDQTLIKSPLIVSNLS